MCGNANGNPSDDSTVTATLGSTWNVTNLAAIIQGSGTISALTPPTVTSNTTVVYTYATDKNLDQFVFDPVCSDGGVENPIPPPPVDGGGGGDLLPPPPDPGTNPPPQDLTPTQAVIDACNSVIKSTAQCTVDAATVAAQQAACAQDMMLAGGNVPTADQLAVLAAAFQSTLCFCPHFCPFLRVFSS